MMPATLKTSNKNFILDVGMQKQELGWRVSVLPIPAFHHCDNYVLQVHTIQWNAGMGNTDTVHPNSCFGSFSIPRSKIFVIGELLEVGGRVGHGLVLAWFESYVLRLVFLDSSLQSPGQEKHFGILFIPLRVTS